MHVPEWPNSYKISKTFIAEQWTEQEVLSTELCSLNEAPLPISYVGFNYHYMSSSFYLIPAGNIYRRCTNPFRTIQSILKCPRNVHLKRVFWYKNQILVLVIHSIKESKQNFYRFLYYMTLTHLDQI